MASAVSAKLSREEHRKKKDLEAARKAGTPPAEVDEHGHEINPHIPQYIARAPWYLNPEQPTLSHQKIPVSHGLRLEERLKRQQTDAWYRRDKILGTAATKYRKGACENCGALTHDAKSCLERPRAKGAKHTGLDIRPDENITNLEFSWESKRDHWSAYDPADHKRVIDDWEKVEEERMKIKAAELEIKLRKKTKEKDKGKGKEDGAEGETSNVTAPEGAISSDPTTGAGTSPDKNKTENGESKKPKDGDSEEESDEEEDDDDDPNMPSNHHSLNDIDDDEDKYADDADMPGQKVDTKSRVTIRNLRMREDRAKYLYNLKLDSALYDPKTRSMRGNPMAEKDPNDLTYGGDNFERYTGDAPHMARLQLFSWEAGDRGTDMHIQSDPSRTELMFREYEKRKEALKNTTRDAILERYGGDEHLKAPPRELVLAQSEGYVEYSRTGKIIKGLEKAMTRSRYEEDVKPGNHSTVWGSWFFRGAWGYACCHQTTKTAYCTGAAGIAAAAETARALEEKEKEIPAVQKSMVEQHLISMLHKEEREKEKAGETTDQASSSHKRKTRVGEDTNITLDSKKVKAAMELEAKRNAAAAVANAQYPTGGKYNRLHNKNYSGVDPNENVNVTEEDLEAFRLSRNQDLDPMAGYKDEDENT